MAQFRPAPSSLSFLKSRNQTLMDSRSSQILLEITLISAQDLLISGLHRLRRRRLRSYASLSASFPGVGPIPTLLTRLDCDGSANPTWNDKFLLRVPAAALTSSSASVSVDLLASGAWCLGDSLLGSVRLLLSNHHLLARPADVPLFAAVGIRRPSGRFQGILNVGLMVLSRVSKRAAQALELSPAVSYRDLMGLGSALKEINGERDVIKLREKQQQPEGDDDEKKKKKKTKMEKKDDFFLRKEGSFRPQIFR